MFDKDLVIVAEYDGKKTIDEIEFTHIPIWVRITKMPLGFMNKTASEMIGTMIGDVLGVDVDDDETAIGQYLRVKIKFDIRRPLMRGVTVDLGDGVKEKVKWCPLIYEYLPDFCYMCGLIGHTDRMCERPIEKGGLQQFTRALRFIPEKKRTTEDFGNRMGGPRQYLPWRPGFMDRESGGSRSGGDSRKGSDSLSWRKEENAKGASKPKPADEEEVKDATASVEGEVAVEKEDAGEKHGDMLDEGAKIALSADSHDNSPMHKNSSMQDGINEDVGGDKRHKFIRVQRKEGAAGKFDAASPGKRKRSLEGLEEMDVDDQRQLKIGRKDGAKVILLKNEAGPTDWSCEDQ